MIPLCPKVYSTGRSGGGSEKEPPLRITNTGVTNSSICVRCWISRKLTSYQSLLWIAISHHFFLLQTLTHYYFMILVIPEELVTLRSTICPCMKYYDIMQSHCLPHITRGHGTFDPVTEILSLLGSLVETPGQMPSLKTSFLFRSLSNEIKALLTCHNFQLHP